VAYMHEDQRPAFILDDVNGADFHHVKAQKAPGRASLHLAKVHNFTAGESTSLDQE
jgi:hypothetical protein